MSTVTCALLLCLLEPAAPPPRLRIDLVFAGLPVKPRVQAAAIEEVTSIWAAYNVDLLVSSPDLVGHDAVLRLAVVIADHPDRHVSPGSLGSIRFRDRLPEPAILVYPNAIATLLSSTPQRRVERECLPALHDLMEGRALGRALAHEIGHYLLRSRHHSVAGLMRAKYVLPDLVDPERRGFFLSADELTRLANELRIWN